jgi:hypothetical protein
MQTGVRTSQRTHPIGQPAQHGDEHPGGPTRLGDATLAFLVVRQAFRRIGGVTSFVVMMIVIGLLVRGLHRMAGPALRKARTALSLDPVRR